LLHGVLLEIDCYIVCQLGGFVTGNLFLFATYSTPLLVFVVVADATNMRLIFYHPIVFPTLILELNNFIKDGNGEVLSVLVKVSLHIFNVMLVRSQPEDVILDSVIYFGTTSYIDSVSNIVPNGIDLSWEIHFTLLTLLCLKHNHWAKK
jgi:hypothetical protein